MSWRVLYPIEDITPYLTTDEIVTSGVKVLLYGGVDPRVFDIHLLADRALRAMNSTRSMKYAREHREKINARKRLLKHSNHQG